MDDLNTRLKGGDSARHLVKNLKALLSVNKPMVARMSYPVGNFHVRQDEGGPVAYLYRRKWHRLSMTADEVEQSLASLPAEGDHFFLFGVGYGDQALALLDRYPTARITVWDRDPWLMRLFLMSRNLKEPLLDGRLRVALNADLLDLVDEAAAAGEAGPSHETASPCEVVHPLLGTIYNTEYRLWKHGVGDRRAVLCEGELFVDDLNEALRDEGYSLFTLDPTLLSLQEMRDALDRIKPEFMASIDYRNGMAEFCRQLGVKLLCWEVNPTVDRVAPCSGSTEGACLFTYRAAQVEEFSRAGYRKVEYLPLAANPQRRAPVALTGKEREKFEAGLSFVGASMVYQAKRLQELFVKRFEDAGAGAPGLREKIVAAMEKVLAGQRLDFSAYRIPELYERHFSELAKTWPGEAREDPVRLLAEVAAAEKRLDYVVALGPQGITVWGDKGWAPLEGQGIQYRGPARHGKQLTKIYCASGINLNIGRLYQSDIVTMRVFDVLACGGFLLTEYNEALGELFEVGRDLEAFRTREEMCDKAAYYLEHPDEARAMAQRGMENVVAKHTVALRVRHMLDALKGE